MEEIKYRYCLNEHKELVDVKKMAQEDEDKHTYFCLQCGQKMKLIKGPKKRRHFSHNPNTVCNGESYLHKLAKRRIREKFMNSKSFLITFYRDVPCEDAEKCQFYSKDMCVAQKEKITKNLKYWKDRILYDTCNEEVKIDNFRPDLLLTSSDPNIRPIIIEIYTTHKSPETKLQSYKSIETKQITSEDDIDDIIKHGFIDGENCKTNNFKPKLPTDIKCIVSIYRFILNRSGKTAVDLVSCDQIKQKLDLNSLRELNYKQIFLPEYDLDSSEDLQICQRGLLYLMRKGVLVRNCILCKYYIYNQVYGCHICKLYKVLGAASPSPEETWANTCNRYELSPDLMKIPNYYLDNNFSEVNP